MKKIVLVLALAICLIFAGCTTGNPPTQGGTGDGATGGAPSGGTTDGATGATNDTTGTSGTNASHGEDTGASGDTGGTETTDYAGMAYGELIAAGVPVQCDITSTYQGQTTTMKLYMQGENRMRAESITGNYTNVMITRDQMSYVKSTVDVPGCEWLAFPINTSGEAGAGAGQTTTPDLGALPSTDFSCLPWIYDESKFTVANACTMEELQQKMMEQYQTQ